MADDRAGLDAVSVHRGGHSHLHRENGRLDLVDALDGLGGRDCLSDRETGLGRDQRLDLGDLGSEHRLGGQQADTHRRPLRALPGEDPDRSSVVVSDRGLIGLFSLGDLAQALDQLGAVVGDHRGPDRTLPAATGQRVGQVGQREVLVAGIDPFGQPISGAAQFVGRGGADREDQQTWGGSLHGSVLGGGLGRLLQNGVDVGTRHAVRGHRRTPRTLVVVDRPIGCFLRNKQTGVDCGEIVRKTVEMQVLGNNTVVHRQDGLHQAQHAGRGLRVTEVGLHRGQRAWTGSAVDARYAVELLGVTYRSAGTVRLDHPDGGGIDTGDRERSLEHGDLCLRGRGEDVLGAAVLVGRGSFDDSKDAVTVALGVGQALEHHDGAALGAHEAVSRDIECMAVSSRRQHALAGGRRVQPLVEHQHHATGERHVALTLVQAAASGVDRHHARRASGVHRQRGPLKAKSV